MQPFTTTFLHTKTKAALKNHHKDETNSKFFAYVCSVPTELAPAGAVEYTAIVPEPLQVLAAEAFAALESTRSS